MGQDNVMEYLKDNKRWVTSKEIAEKIGINLSSTCESLRKLIRRNDGHKVEMKVVTNKHKVGRVYMYKYIGQEKGDDYEFI